MEAPCPRIAKDMGKVSKEPANGVIRFPAIVGTVPFT
jgi:hypothetical protein